jgi:hypothetical protein
MKQQQELARALAQLKVLALSLPEFQVRFGHILRFERTGSDFKLDMLKPFPLTTAVSLEDIQVVLAKQQRGDISTAVLQEWANFLLLCDAYEIMSGADEELRDCAVTVLQRIATPEINSELTDAMVKYYLGCLEAGQTPEL